MRKNIEYGLRGNKEGLRDKPTELKTQSYSIEQDVPRMVIDETRQIRPNYCTESIQGTVTKALRLVAQNEIQ